uniref:Peptide-methionine (R)-S-oxide reductase n=1 Tax=Panagrolaimus sp. ES5 TaxID=591445 RepID=A0AC34FHZ0_9BILA
MAESAGFESALKKLGKTDPKTVTDAEWKSVLTPEEYEITRKAGTEPAHSGALTKNLKDGNYKCTCCGVDLFVSSTKFVSSCGWPAFNESVEKDKNIVRIPDNSFGINRTEVRCKNCNAHLGHVFEEDDQPTGERYCINSCSIKFQPKDKP